MSSKINYVADHIDRIERRHGGKESLILDSKWRIASNADLFPCGTLAADGSLTREQITQIDRFIAEFKQQYPDAIAQYQQKAAS